MKRINSYIDHTLLKPDASKQDIKNLCLQAKKYQFAAVCVNPYYVKFAKNLLSKTSVKICTVIGFPLGQSTSKVKLYEAVDAIKNGADEIDMVINIAALKDKDINYVIEEIKQIKKICYQNHCLLKIIIETCLLDKKQKLLACQIAKKTQVDFVKTSTGFSFAGAKLEDIKYLRKHLPLSIQLKASGGIKNYQEAEALINAGANRLGTSHSLNLLKEIKKCK